MKLFERFQENPYGNIVLDFDPNPKYMGTYDFDKERIILRVGNFGGYEGITMLLWAIQHESIHIVLYKKFPDMESTSIEWYQVAGMDYVEDTKHPRGLVEPMEKCYSELAPKAFEFRKKFDINFISV